MVSIRKSTSISNADTIPVTPNSVGEGAPGDLRTVNDLATAVTSDVQASVYRICRLPPNAKVKQVLFNSDALSTSTTLDLDVAYSDSTTDGTAPANQGKIIQVSASDNKLFGSGIDVSSAVVQADKTFANTFTTADQNEELWEVLGLASNPGGMFDIVAKVANSGGVTAGGNIAVEVRYVL